MPLPRTACSARHCSCWGTSASSPRAVLTFSSSRPVLCRATYWRFVRPVSDQRDGHAVGGLGRQQPVVLHQHVDLVHPLVLQLDAHAAAVRRACRSRGATVFCRSMGALIRASAIEAGNWKETSRMPARRTVNVSTTVSSTTRSVTRTLLIVSQVTSGLRAASCSVP